MKTYQHQGVTIERTPFGRFETPSLKWGEWGGEHYSFLTLTAAKAFIDRRQDEGRIDMHGRLDGRSPLLAPTDVMPYYGR